MFEKFKKILKKMNEGYFYIVDYNKFHDFICNEVNFADENKLEYVVNLKIHFYEKTYNLNIWDFRKSDIKDEQIKGLSVTLNNIEYNSIDNLFNTASLDNTKLNELKYLKIELIDGDSTELNKYKEEHPELNDDFLQLNQ